MSHVWALVWASCAIVLSAELGALEAHPVEKAPLFPGSVVITDWTEEGVATLVITEWGPEESAFVWLCRVSLIEKRVLAADRIPAPGGLARQARLLHDREGTPQVVLTTHGRRSLSRLDLERRRVQPVHTLGPAAAIQFVPSFESSTGSAVPRMAFLGSVREKRSLFVHDCDESSVASWLVPDDLEVKFVWLAQEESGMAGLASRSLTHDGYREVVRFRSTDHGQLLIDEDHAWSVNGHMSFGLTGVSRDPQTADVLLLGHDLQGMFRASLYSPNGTRRWTRQGPEGEGGVRADYFSRQGIVFCALPEAHPWGNGTVLEIGLGGDVRPLASGDMGFDHFGASMHVVEREEELLAVVGGERVRIGESSYLQCFHRTGEETDSFPITLSDLRSALGGPMDEEDR